MSTPMEAFFRKGNKVLRTTFAPAENPDFDITHVHNAHLKDGECELLTIRTQTERRVIISGSVVVVHALEGHGRLEMIDLPTGKTSSAPLEPGNRLHVPSNNVTFLYQNVGQNALVLARTCLGFNQVNQPPLTDVVYALTNVLLG